MERRDQTESLAQRMLRTEARIGGGAHFHDGRNDESLEPIQPIAEMAGSGWVEYSTGSDGIAHVTFHDGDEVAIDH